MRGGELADSLACTNEFGFRRARVWIKIYLLVEPESVFDFEACG